MKLVTGNVRTQASSVLFNPSNTSEVTEMTASERIKQARESMEEALLFSREHMSNKLVMIKLYHAMMESLFALFNIRDMGRLTHADVIERFEQEYIRSGRINAKILEALRRAYDLTHECDCDHMPVPTDGEIASAMKAAEELISATERLSEASSDHAA
jgi:uncharacterized protein (UPF0332 family)